MAVDKFCCSFFYNKNVNDLINHQTLYPTLMIKNYIFDKREQNWLIACIVCIYDIIYKYQNFNLAFD